MKYVTDLNIDIHCFVKLVLGLKKNIEFNNLMIEINLVDAKFWIILIIFGEILNWMILVVYWIQFCWSSDIIENWLLNIDLIEVSKGIFENYNEVQTCINNFEICDI
jgi:hypothetical protein